MTDPDHPRGRAAGRRGAAVGLALLLAVAVGCGPRPAVEEPGPAAGPASTAAPAPRATSPSPGLSRPTSPTVSTTSTPTTSTPTTRSTPRSPATDGPRPGCVDRSVPRGLSLAGARDETWAFAPLDGSRPAVVEGRVPEQPAWSTSKVLVVAAYLDAVADGDPDRVPAADRRAISAALTRSDEDAVLRLRDRIPGSSGRAMTAVLRSVGDRTTVAPDSYQGTMRWSAREQVRFLQALAAGRVVSRAASRYLLAAMRPVPEHSWGLGSVGASAFKGGWLRRSSPTRQLGVVDGYAVAIGTVRGPAVVQSDGDAAHVAGMNRLAHRLAERLAWERGCS